MPFAPLRPVSSPGTRASRRVAVAVALLVAAALALGGSMASADAVAERHVVTSAVEDAVRVDQPGPVRRHGAISTIRHAARPSRVERPVRSVAAPRGRAPDDRGPATMADHRPACRRGPPSLSR